MSLLRVPNRRRLQFEQLELRCLLSANPGDYSANGLVDASDYILWRKADPRADSNGDTHIDQVDFNAWRSTYGTPYLPGSFQITGPSHVLTNTDQFTVSWTPAVGATSYKVRISNAPDLSTTFYSADSTTTSLQITNFAEGNFYLGVTAMNDAGSTTASNQGYYFETNNPDAGQLIFVTHQAFFIDPFNSDPPDVNTFGSPAAADYQATGAAANAGRLAQPWDGFAIHFRALVTQTLTGVQQAASMSNENYYNTRGELIAHSLPQLMSGNWLAQMYDENGNTVAGVNVPVWTGANPDGSWSTLTANNWSSINSSATIGRLNGAGTSWISFGTRSSQLSARLYAAGDLQVPYGSFNTFQRSGSADPATQGFTAWTYGDASVVGPVANDLGHAAWSIAGSSQTSQSGYLKPITAANNLALIHQGFIMSFDARVAQGLAPAYDSANRVVVANAKVDVNNRRYDVALGIDANGDTVVTLPTSVDAAGPGSSVRMAGASYTLVGSGSSWHNYQLIYDPRDDSAHLLVDGMLRLQDYTGHTNFIEQDFRFNALSGGQANFDAVKLELLWPNLFPGSGSGPATASLSTPAPATSLDLALANFGSTGAPAPSSERSALNATATPSSPSPNNNLELLAEYALRPTTDHLRAYGDAHSQSDDETTEVASPDSLWTQFCDALKLG